ncbi:MAG TPA: cupin domain-containing protein [Candidatus Thermoplasmatota archaeon]|nr:cupin domain-containing protein [Candidatus Thermoplasmatota archaeon]
MKKENTFVMVVMEGNGKQRLNSILCCNFPGAKKMKNEIEQKNMDTLVAQARRLVDLAEYQDDSVVSRMVLNKESGSVTLFAFDEGQSLSEHTAPFDALVQILEGEAVITISGKNFHITNGEVIIMPANKPHAVKAVKKFKMMLTMIKS